MKARTSRYVNQTETRRLSTIERRLRTAYGQPRHHNPRNPLNDLMFLVLSRMTQETKYIRTYRRLRTVFPRWASVHDAPRRRVESVLKYAGLASTKSRDIKGILREIKRREGRLSLSRLCRLGDDEALSYLTSLPGVSRKTALCVMLYSLGRAAFPVDAHVWRIAGRLGLAPKRTWNERDAMKLESKIPHRIKSSLHVTLLAHGRAVCSARTTQCDRCVIVDLCPSALVGEPRFHRPIPKSG